MSFSSFPSKLKKDEKKSKKKKKKKRKKGEEESSGSSNSSSDDDGKKKKKKREKKRSKVAPPPKTWMESTAGDKNLLLLSLSSTAVPKYTLEKVRDETVKWPRFNADVRALNKASRRSIDDDDEPEQTRPGDTVKSWLLLAASHATNGGDQTKAVLERQLGVLEDAVRVNPTSTDLLLERMRLAQQVSREDLAEVDRLWEETIQGPEVGTLLRTRLRWSSFTGATAMRSSFKECLGKQQDDLSMVELLVSQAREERRCGYAERGLALLQASLELSENISKENAPALIEAYWEAEAPRVGECDSSGFAKWLQRKHRWLIAKIAKLPEPEELTTAGNLKLDDLDDKKQESAPQAVVKEEPVEKPPEVTTAPPAAAAAAPAVVKEEAGEKPPDVTAPVPEGLWSLQSDGTVYSVKHGHRISLNTDSGSEYSRVLKELQEGLSEAEIAEAEAKRQQQEVLLLQDVDADDAFREWARAEADLDRRQWAPIRGKLQPELALEQPERLVLFGDISPHLCSVGWSARRLLALRLVEFCGVRLPLFAGPKCLDADVIQEDPLAAELLLNDDWTSALSGDNNEEEDLLAQLDDDHRLIFVGSSRKRACFARNVLAAQEAVPDAPDPVWAGQVKSALLELDFEISLDPVATRLAEARSPLKTGAPLELWRTYALLAARKGRKEEALRVCHGALAHSESIDGDRNALVALHATTARLQLLSAKKQSMGAVSKQLSGLATSSKVGEVLNVDDLIRSGELLKLELQRSTAQSAVDRIAIDRTLPLYHAALCLAYFEYAATGDCAAGIAGLDAGLAALDNVRVALNASSGSLAAAAVELTAARLHRARCELALLGFGGTHPRTRDIVTEGRAAAPCDAVLGRLELKMRWSQQRTSNKLGPSFARAFDLNSGDCSLLFEVMRRTLAFYDSITLENLEKQQQQQQRKRHISPVLMIKALFEALLANVDSRRAAPTVWRLYLRYAIHRKSYAEAKKIFFRAVHATPGSKQIWLEAPLSLRGLFAKEDLLQIIQEALTKEVALRSSLDELVV